MSRQAYYQHNWSNEIKIIEEMLILQEVKMIRTKHKRMGTRKLYDKLQNFMQEHSIKMGYSIY